MANFDLKAKGIIIIIVGIVLFSLRYVQTIPVNIEIFNVNNISIESASKVCATPVSIVLEFCDIINLLNILLIIIPAIFTLYGLYLLVASDWMKKHKEVEIDFGHIAYVIALIVIIILIIILIWIRIKSII